MITIFFTRHSKSTRNLYDSNGCPPIYGVSDVSFRDTALCPDGIEKVIAKRNKKIEKMGKIDAIITSPLKRCIQTSLLTYQHITHGIEPIYVMPLVMEYGNAHDSLGVPMRHIFNDPDIFSYRHFMALNFDYFTEGFYSNIVQNLNFNVDTMEWTILDYRMNPLRSEWFFDFLRTHFRGKRIHVVTHSMFMYSIIGFIPDNYETVKVDYNPDTGEISWNKI
jgi:broad specificity phosphatase PhoE